MIFNFEKFSIDVDVEQTRLYYNSANFISENCSCSGCRNYEKAVELFSQPITSFFSELGVAMKKYSEVYVNCTNDDHSVFYGGFYHICGRVINGESAWVSDSPNHAHWENEKAFALTENFRVSFHEKCNLLSENFPRPAIQLEISANIPWVLDEPNTYKR